MILNEKAQVKNSCYHLIPDLIKAKKHRTKSVLSYLIKLKTIYFLAAGFLAAGFFAVVVVFLAVAAFLAAGFFFSAKALGS